MNESIKKLADKYFRNVCMPEEAERVLQWLETEEGEQYLNEKIATDFDAFEGDDEEDKSFSEEVDSEKLLVSIISRVNRYGFRQHRHSVYFNRFVQIAAGILVILTASIFYQYQFVSVEQEPEISDVRFSTNQNEQRNIRLGDGTKIRLNSNSELTIYDGYMNGNREVNLYGEAFFDVKNQSDKSFIIHTNLARVEVLGTSFNVKHTEHSRRVEVAVIDGMVALAGNHAEEQRRVTLGKGDYAYWDDELKVLNKEQFGAENYLAWMTGELVFEYLPMAQVCIQLNRFYDVSCVFETDEIKLLGLHAHIPAPGLKNTLSVIALSLNLSYRLEGGMIFWSVSTTNEN